MSPPDGCGAVAAPVPGANRREPIARRTLSPVRRNSRHAGDAESQVWRPFNAKHVGNTLLAAERFERAHKQFGKRVGPLGSIGLEVLRELLRMVDFKTGRLEPAITTIMARLNRCKDAVVRALAALRRHGFLTWIRRYEETGERGQRGPQVKQISNAYGLRMPAIALRLLGRRAEDAPTPDDHDHAQQAAHSARKACQLDDDNDPLGSSLSRLGRKVQERESARRSESGPGDIKGGVQRP